MPRGQSEGTNLPAADWPIHHWRQAGEGSQSWKWAFAAPEMASSTKLQAGLVANQDFLGFWTVNIHLRRCTGCTSRKPSSGEAISGNNRARQTPHHLSCSDLGRAQNAGPTESAPLRTSRVPEPERLRPGRCRQPRNGLGWFLAEQPRA